VSGQGRSAAAGSVCAQVNFIGRPTRHALAYGLSVLQTVLDAGLTEHRGDGKGDPAGRGGGEMSSTWPLPISDHDKDVDILALGSRYPGCAQGARLVGFGVLRVGAVSGRVMIRSGGEAKTPRWRLSPAASVAAAQSAVRIRIYFAD
jgi:hypothetical protein